MREDNSPHAAHALFGLYVGLAAGLVASVLIFGWMLLLALLVRWSASAAGLGEPPLLPTAGIFFVLHAAALGVAMTNRRP